VNINVGIALYIVTGVLVAWSIRTNGKAIIDLAIKLDRIVPGFSSNFLRSGNTFGFGSEARLLQSIWSVVSWPISVIALATMLFAGRKVDQIEEKKSKLRKLEGQMKELDGGIFDHNRNEALIKDIVEHRCRQVGEVFATITMAERTWFADFAQKVFSPDVLLPMGVETFALSLGGAKGPDDTLDPGQAHAALVLKPLRLDGPKEVSISFQHQRELWVASGTPPQPVTSFIRMSVVLARESGFGVIDVEWRQVDDFAGYRWVLAVSREELNGLPLADNANDDDVKAWSKASIGNEESVAHRLLSNMGDVLNGSVA
jgi:hypothetical protein